MASVVEESNDETLNINSFPEEMLIKIFSYLSQKELGKIARVCKRWSVLTQSAILWKKVNLEFPPTNGSQITIAEHYLNFLPPCVTCLKLNFIDRWCWAEQLNFEKLAVTLKERCPHLEMLILEEVTLTDSLQSIISLCSLFLHTLKSLMFHLCEFSGCSERECVDISKIEVLDIKLCNLGKCYKTSFSKLSYLKQLRLFGTSVIDFWFHNDFSFLNQLHVLDLGGTKIDSSKFEAIRYHGLQLKELYLCFAFLQDSDFKFSNLMFPNLKAVCLSYCRRITCEGVVSLIQSCPSLQNVYVDEDVAESYATHPFVAGNRCKTGIVKAINITHTHKYLCKQ